MRRSLRPGPCWFRDFAQRDKRVPINDSWIAATAIAHRVPLITQDSDYGAMPDVEVIKI